MDDVAEAFVALLDGNVRGPVNIGSGNGVAVREVIELAGAAVGRPDLIRFGAVETRSDEAWCCSVMEVTGRTLTPLSSIRNGYSLVPW